MKHVQPKPEAWWDTRLEDPQAYSEFVKNLGTAAMASRVAVRAFATELALTSVLDVGCGPALDRWTDTDIAWTGVDGSKYLVTENAKRGVQTTHAPADKLPYASASFDLVYSRHVWEHLADFRGALAEACRVAKRAVAIVFFRPPGEQARVRIDDGTYYNDYKLADIQAAFKDAWPECSIRTTWLPVATHLPFGELILFVTKGCS